MSQLERGRIIAPAIRTFTTSTIGEGHAEPSSITHRHTFAKQALGIPPIPAETSRFYRTANIDMGLPDP